LRSISTKQFRKKIYDYYRSHGRDLAWRKTDNPYDITVSEIMLQQTQVERVRAKYEEFMRAFPTLRSLAVASLRDVLVVWQGLGYNRRARALKQLAETVLRVHNGKIPHTEDELVKLPGIGRVTARSILAFAFHLPTVFIETNIRSVFINFYFAHARKVSDREIMPLVEKTLDRHNPRTWYDALMDYGVFLKKQNPSLLARSSHYKKQAPFHGSRRQLRGAVVRLLSQSKSRTQAEIAAALKADVKKTKSVLAQLCQEGFLTIQAERYRIVEDTTRLKE
jgi:A/G-specific adenine glycosylase